MRYLTLEEASVFHGHLGPYLIIGYRAGELARKILNPSNEFDLQAKVTLPLKTPYTCIVDGIQCSTKCTLGKLNIELVDSGSICNIVIEFKRKSSNKTLKLKVRESVIRKLHEITDVNEGARWVKTLSVEDLFEIVMNT
ncbi:MAG TPA: hypothetical protein EYH40_00200 [Desulfurococcales archaeon]|nr:hypothetical protein [Desulfurococcales archaeon]